MTNNKKIKIAFSIAAFTLFLALLDGWQYGFFTILRFVVFSTTAYVAYLAHQDQKEGWTWLLGAIAVLFNPLIPIHLTRDVWVVIDFITAISLIFAMFKLKFTGESK